MKSNAGAISSRGVPSANYLAPAVDRSHPDGMTAERLYIIEPYKGGRNLQEPASGAPALWVRSSLLNLPVLYVNTI